MSDSVLLQPQALWQRLTAIFGVGGRYRREKWMVVGGYLLSSALVIAWSFSAPSQAPTNALGAQVQTHTVEGSQERWYTVRNKSDDTWDGLRLTLNARYFWEHTEEVKPGQQLEMNNKDFLDRLYVPRAPRAGTWGDASARPALSSQAPRDLAPQILLLEAEQGKLTHRF